MTGERLGPVSGLLLCLCWSPMALAIPRLPDLGSQAAVEQFWRDNNDLMQFVIVSVSVGYLFLLFFLGALTARLRAVDRSETLTWTAFGSALMFMTLLNAAVGLDAAAGLLLADGPPGATYSLHAAGFILAAPATFAGFAFFAAVALLALSRGALPRWIGWLAVVGAAANIGTIGGNVTLTGPGNSGNGAVGGIAAPLGLYVFWILCVSVWWLRQPSPASLDGSAVGRAG
jgi:hypothetical protein